MKTIKAVAFDVTVTAVILIATILITAHCSAAECESPSSMIPKLEYAWSANCSGSDRSITCVSWYNPWADPRSQHPNAANGGGYYAFRYECKAGTWWTVDAWWEK